MQTFFKFSPHQSSEQPNWGDSAALLNYIKFRSTVEGFLHGKFFMRSIYITVVKIAIFIVSF